MSLQFDATIKNEGDYLVFYLESDKAKNALKNSSDQVRNAFKPYGSMLRWSGIPLDRRRALKGFCKQHDLKVLTF
jgi:hypothetical protein